MSVKDSTANEYRKKVAKLDKDGFSKLSWTENPSGVLDHIKGLAESTQKGYLSAIKFTLDGVVPKPIQDRIDELYKAQNEKAKAQIQTPKQMEVMKDLTWDDVDKTNQINSYKDILGRIYLRDRYFQEKESLKTGFGIPPADDMLEDFIRDKGIKRNTNISDGSEDRYYGIPPSRLGGTGGGANNPEVFADRMLVCALYTLQAPVRLDYVDMRISNGLYITTDGNECILKTRTTSYFIFRKYKTDKTYGTVEIPINPKLYDLIKFAMACSPRSEVLLYKSSAVLGNIIREEFSEDKDHKVGIDILRHLYIMEHFPKLKTIKEKDELARRMLHSRFTSETYNLVGKEED